MKFLGSDKAVSEVIGHIFILGITITGIAMIALVGMPVIYKLQEMVNVRNSEQIFTVLDSRASIAVLGESPTQIIGLNLGGGILSVEPNGTGRESYITVRRESENDVIKIPMGKVKYTLGDRTVAYEGGGIWSKYPSGGSVMLSPPEFHYNGKTLTLPVINITMNNSIAGKGSVEIAVMKNTTLVMFPNTSMGANRSNPVNFTIVRKVYVNVTSDYYDAWAEHIKNSGSANVSLNASSSTANILLTVYPPYIGKINSITNPINFRGLDPGDLTPLDNFSFTISGADHSFQWDIRAKSLSGTKRLIFDFKEDGGYITLKVGYEDDALAGYSDHAETWKGNELFKIQGGIVNVDLLNTSVNLTYESEGVGTTASCNPDQIKSNEFNDTGFSWTDRTVNKNWPNNRQSLYNITQHYIYLMAQEGDIAFNQCSPAGKHGPATDSTMYVVYDAPGGLTYLHITDNRADVSVS